MSDTIEAMRLDALLLQEAPVHLRAIAADNAPRWLVSLEPHSSQGAWETAIVAAAETNAEPLRTISHGLFSPPPWDVAAAADGALEFVAGIFGGASTEIVLLESAADVAVSLRNRTEPFFAPRFVREPAAERPRITASNGDAWVLFAPEGDDYGAYTVLTPGRDGLLFARESGLTGIVLRDLPRPTRGDGALAMTLHRVDFDEHLRPTSERALLDGEAVFGLAAEHFGDGIAVLVALEQGAALLADNNSVIRFAGDHVLSSPALAAAGGALYAGFLAERQLVTGEIALTS